MKLYCLRFAVLKRRCSYSISLKCLYFEIFIKLDKLFLFDNTDSLKISPLCTENMKIYRFYTLTTQLNNYKVIRLFIQYLGKFFIKIFTTHLQIASLQWHFIIITSHVDIHTYAVTFIQRLKIFHSLIYFYIRRKERRLSNKLDFAMLIYIVKHLQFHTSWI